MMPKWLFLAAAALALLVAAGVAVLLLMRDGNGSYRHDGWSASGDVAMRSLFRTRRRTVAIGLAVLAGISAAYLYFGRSRLTEEAYSRLRLGMTLEEVETALAIRSGQYLGDPTPDRVFVFGSLESTFALDQAVHVSGPTGPGTDVIRSRATGEVVAERRSWVDGEHWITVMLRDGRVVSKTHATAAVPLHKYWFRRLWNRLGL